MYICKFAVCGESVVRDTETNTVSIFNIIEEIRSPGFPAVVHRVSCIFFLVREEGDQHQVETTVKASLEAQELTQFPVNVDFGEKVINRVVVVISPMVVPGPGNLRISIEIGDQELGGWDISVRQIGGPQIQVDQG